MANTAFYLFSSTNYPYDSYFIGFDPQVFQQSSTYPIINMVKFQKNYMCDVIPSFDDTYSNYVTYHNTDSYQTNQLYTTSVANTTAIELVNLIGVTNINTTYDTNTYIKYDSSNLRQYFKCNREMNIVYVEDSNITTEMVNYGYILYPNRIFIYPIKLQYDGANYLLYSTVQTVCANFVTFDAVSGIVDINGVYSTNWDTSNFNSEAAIYHYEYMSKPPTNFSTKNYELTNLQLDVWQRTSSYGYPLSTTNNASTPINSTFPIVDSDSTFFQYLAYYTDSAGTHNVSQPYFGIERTDKKPSFASTFILSGTNLTKQRFQFIQSLQAGQSESNLYKFQNCVMYVDYDLSTNTASLSYSSKAGFPTTVNEFNFFQHSGFLSVNYNAYSNSLNDYSSAMHYSGTDTHTVASIPFSDNSLSLQSLGSMDKPYWYVLKLPPHYYTFQASIIDNSSGKTLDFSNLNFNVKSSVLKNEIQSVTLSSYFASDFNALTYPLSLDPNSLQIRYTIVDALSSIILQNLQAYYEYDNANDQYPYNLNTNNWIPVTQSFSNAKFSKFVITYPSVTLGPTTLSIATQLRVSLDKGVTYRYFDNYEVTNVELGYDYNQQYGANLNLNNVVESSNSITCDASQNVSETSWPYVNLSNSNISWHIDTKRPQNITITAVDQNGTTLQQIQPDTNINFDSNSWRVLIKGYGPDLAVITLSSQKYNQVASLSTNQNLFNYFSENAFSITPSVDLNNLNEIRTITLQAQVPFEGQSYNIPYSIPIYWKWYYNDISDPSVQPISAYDIDMEPYQHGITGPSTSLSSINILINPKTVDLNPRDNKVTVNVYSDILNPPIIGSYTFYVDDFPSNKTYSSDFYMEYANFLNTDYTGTKIIDTINNVKVLPRSDADTDFYFILIPNNNNIISANPQQINLSIIDNNLNSINTTNLNEGQTNNWNALYDGGYQPAYYINLTSNSASAYNVKLDILSAKPIGWNYMHNFTQNISIYKIPSISFNEKIDFILYPQYIFEGSNVTFLDATNYTLAYLPSAYENKSNSTYNFWLSTNIFDNKYNQYLYTLGVNSVSTASAIDILPLIYDPTDPTIYAGIYVSLSAYNDVYFPQSIGNTYVVPSQDGTKLVTSAFNNFSETVTRTPLDGVTNYFKYSPIIVRYPNVIFDFNILNNSLELDYTNTVDINQIISLDDANSPVIVLNSSNVEYTLSNIYWSFTNKLYYNPSKDVNPDLLDSYETVFSLNIGDPAVVLNSGERGEDNFNIVASPDIIIQIPDLLLPDGNVEQWNPIELKS